ERGFSSSNAASTASARAASPSSIASAHCSWPTPRNSCAIPSWSRTRERSIARRKSVTIRSSTRAACTARSCDRREPAMPTLPAPRALQSSQRIWDQEILPALYEYIRIPNKSPAYEPRWQQNMDRAVALIEAWCRKQPIAGLSLEAVRLEHHTPVIYMEAPVPASETCLLYGHRARPPDM